ncbi:MAG: hypothetical protein LBB74_10775 [Chitinispirillales bacterium]|jgi:hypothetical protein|nr:hypothetical protein [Chitinispirillales bacterium]
MFTIAKHILPPLCVVVALLSAACDESDAVVRGKLDVILADDLAAIIDSVSAAALMDEPRFELVSYKEYNEGAYSRMAVTDFFFLKPLVGVEKKIRRKYRYHRRFGMWDRYHNMYYTVAPDTVSAEGGGGGE